MKKVRIDDIEKGMILAKDVRGSSGNVLLNKGFGLTEAIAKRLKKWEVYVVYVEGEEEKDEDDTVISHTSEDIRGSLEKKFSDVMNFPLMKKLFMEVVNHRTKNNIE